MQMRTIEISVGAFVLAGILALVVLMVRVSGVSFTPESGSYTLYAEFEDVAGLRERAKVSMAGVTVGRVEGISVDAEYGIAVVEMSIRDEVGPLSMDTGASILTEGILGARYIGLMPGAEEDKLADGDYISDTQPALVLEKLIGNLVTRLGGS